MSLIRFNAVNINNITSLANKELWFSKLDALNDPFEGKYKSDDDLSNIDLSDENMNKFIKYIKEETKQSIKGTQDNYLSSYNISKKNILKLAEFYLSNLKHVLQDKKIYCMSENGDTDDLVKNNLMWSHYADGLRGFCLVFDARKLMLSLKKLNNDVPMDIQRISYLNTPNIISLSDFYHKAISGKHYVEEARKFTLTKSKHWEHEKEIRIFTQKEDNLHKYSSDALLKIIIGNKMPKNQQNLITDIAEKHYPETSLKKAILGNGYQIKITKL